MKRLRYKRSTFKRVLAHLENPVCFPSFDQTRDEVLEEPGEQDRLSTGMRPCQDSMVRNAFFFHDRSVGKRIRDPFGVGKVALVDYGAAMAHAKVCNGEEKGFQFVDIGCRESFQHISFARAGVIPEVDDVEPHDRLERWVKGYAIGVEEASDTVFIPGPNCLWAYISVNLPVAEHLAVFCWPPKLVKPQCTNQKKTYPLLPGVRS